MRIPRNLARVALAAAFIVGCSPTPPATARPSALGTPVAPPATESPRAGSPSPTATVAAPVEPTPPLEHVAIQWQRVPELEGHSIQGLTVGPAGWVAVGDCLTQDITVSGCPTVWTSDDGLTWSDRGMPHEWNDTGFSEIAATKEGYTAFGDDSERNVILPRSEWGARVWRSDDGRSWEISRTTLHDLLRRGESIHDLAVTPSGTLLATVLRTRGAQFQYTGPWVSDDGRDWRLLGPARFGLETLNVETIGSSSPAAYVAGWPCGACDVDTLYDGQSTSSGIWTSVDGIEWTEVAPIGSLPGPAVSFATDGTSSVALLRICTDGECRKEVWASGAGGAWTFAYGPIDGDGLQQIQLVSADSAFLAVRRGYDVLASFDGLTWTAVESDTDTVEGVCGPGYVAVRGKVIVAVHGAGEDYGYGSERCPAWRGTISVVSGPGEPPASFAPGTTIPPDD